MTKELDSRWDRIRLWLFNRFSQDVIDLSQDKYTQGFSDGYKTGFEQKLAEHKEIVAQLNERIEQLQLGNAKLPAVDFTHVLTARGKTLVLGGDEVKPQLATNLRAEASALSRMELWKIFQETLKFEAYRVMFEKSETFDDMKSGKLMLYNLGVQKNIVDILLAKS